MSAPAGIRTRPGPGDAAKRPSAARDARDPPAGPVREGAAALGRWAAARAKDLEVVAQRRDADGPMVDRALEIVRKFIVERGLILFGGLAIDYALRLKGSRIYPDDERPDFDFLSPRSVDDAYDLADILQRAGFEGVGAIRAIHVQTMRVRTNFVYVADIGYAPREVFDRLPTVEYQGMRVIHPDFQRMDQHLAFCFPFNGPPREDVFHRWRKDLKRFNLYDEFYPIEAPPQGEKTSSDRRIVTGRLAVPVVGNARDLQVALHGFAAYAALRAALDELAAAFRAEARTDAPALELNFPDDRSVSVETPAGDAVHVASPEPDAAVVGLEDVRWYDPYMDVNPEAARAGAAVVLSTRGRLLAATVVAVRGPGGKTAQAVVVTPQYLLLHFLFEAHRSTGAARETYRAYYRHTLGVLRAAEDIFADRLQELDAPAAREALMEEFALSPFAPTVRTLGTINNDAAYIIKMATNAEKLRDTPPAALGLPPDVASILDGLPLNYYPGGGKPRPPFDYGANVLFRRAGLPRTPSEGGPRPGAASE